MGVFVKLQLLNGMTYLTLWHLTSVFVRTKWKRGPTLKSWKRAFQLTVSVRRGLKDHKRPSTHTVKNHQWMWKKPECVLLQVLTTLHSLQFGVQHHHPRHPLLHTHPAHCASPHPSVAHKLLDRQEAAGEPGENHIQHPDNQHRRPPGLCALPTALLPLHQQLRLRRPIC